MVFQTIDAGATNIGDRLGVLGSSFNTIKEDAVIATNGMSGGFKKLKLLLSLFNTLNTSSAITTKDSEILRTYVNELRGSVALIILIQLN